METWKKKKGTKSVPNRTPEILLLQSVAFFLSGICLSVADPVGLRRGVHHSIETPNDEGICMDAGFPLSLVGVWGTAPKKISEK